MFSETQLREIFSRTFGHCHFCGDKLKLPLYGSRNSEDVRGAWEVDHVNQRAKGGAKSADNCLPACIRCNRLRWHRKGSQIRELILFGLIAKDEIKKKSELGKLLNKLKQSRLTRNKQRRRRTLNFS
jgi:5-methylcytosine-specific restriction endonuclease McrA